MKKVTALLLSLAMCLSLCACGTSLTAEQKAAKNAADEKFEQLCEMVPNTSYKASLKVVDGKTVYLVHLDSEEDIVNVVGPVFSELGIPAAFDALCEVDIHPVMYLGDEYRIFDSVHLNEEIADALE